jgi:hypothetical protein
LDLRNEPVRELDRFDCRIISIDNVTAAEFYRIERLFPREVISRF